MTIAISIYCLLFAFLAYRRPNLALYFIIATLPSYLIRSSLWGIPFTLLEAMIIILFVIFLIKNRLDWVGRFYRQPFFWPIVVILIIATVSMLMSPYLTGAAGIFKAYFIEPILFFIVLISLRPVVSSLRGSSSDRGNPVNIKNHQNQTHTQNILWSLGISAIYISVFALWQKFSGLYVPDAFLTVSGSVDRVVSIFGYPNALGLYLGPIIILFTGFLFFPLLIPKQGATYLSTLLTHLSASGGKERVKGELPKKSKNQFSFWHSRIFCQTIKIVVIVLSLITIILAQSEAAILSIVIVWLFWGLLYKKTRVMALVVIVVAIILFFSVPTFGDTLTTKVMLQDWSGIVRRHIWQETEIMLKDNPIWGAGLAGYQTKIMPYHKADFEVFLYPHNIILNFWSELGILGLLAFIWLTILYLYQNIISAIRNKDKVIYLTLTAVTIQMIIHGLVDVPYFKNDLAVLFWIVIAILIIWKGAGAVERGALEKH